MMLSQATSDDEKSRTTLALSILALEEGAVEEARALYAQSGLQPGQMQQHPWLIEVPDALEKLAERP